MAWFKGLYDLMIGNYAITLLLVVLVAGYLFLSGNADIAAWEPIKEEILFFVSASALLLFIVLLSKAGRSKIKN